MAEGISLDVLDAVRRALAEARFGDLTAAARTAASIEEADGAGSRGVGSELREFLSELAASHAERERILGEIEMSHADLAHANRRLREEMESRLQAESELRLAQKLEAIGRLAAGVAHEINTPTQYVSDNVTFLRDAFRSLMRSLDVLLELNDPGSGSIPWEERRARVQAMVEDLDLEYIQRESLRAIDQSAEGLSRVASIVRAMKEFSHPGEQALSVVDLNRALETTVTVSRNEWKHVADVVLDLDPELPQVMGHLGELNQVFLNAIVNAAQALGGRGAGAGQGTIRISTRRVDDEVEVTIEDDGPGVPAHLVDKVFDPFFTTKDVGAGTGQGLAVARSIVVDKHRGRIRLESDPGRRTAVVVRLPAALPPGRRATA